MRLDNCADRHMTLCISTVCGKHCVNCVCIHSGIPGMCSSLHVMHTHDNGGLTHVELIPTNDIIMDYSLP